MSHSTSGESLIINTQSWSAPIKEEPPITPPPMTIVDNSTRFKPSFQPESLHKGKHVSKDVSLDKRKNQKKPDGKTPKYIVKKYLIKLFCFKVKLRRNVVGKKGKESLGKRLGRAHLERINDNMCVNIVRGPMIGTTTSTGTKSMSVARKMHSSVQNVGESFLTSKTVFITLNESTKLFMKPLINI